MLGFKHLETPMVNDKRDLGALFPRLIQPDLAWTQAVKPAQFVSIIAIDNGRVILCDDEKQGLNLPSGAVEPTDRSPKHAARRELREELGIQSAQLRRFGTITVPDEQSPHAVALFVGKVNEFPGKPGTKTVHLPIQDALDFMPARLANLAHKLKARLQGEEDPSAHTGFGFNINYDVKNGHLVEDIQYTDS